MNLECALTNNNLASVTEASAHRELATPFVMKVNLSLKYASYSSRCPLYVWSAVCGWY